MKRRVEIIIVVTYNDKYYDEYDENVYKAAETTETCGSGLGFGGRDLEFEFTSDIKAERALKRFRRLKYVREIKVERTEIFK